VSLSFDQLRNKIAVKFCIVIATIKKVFIS